MSKHRHSKDKLYITYSEHMQEREGKKKIRQLLLLDYPLIIVHYLLNHLRILYAHLKVIKYKRNPINGQSLRTNDLIQLKFNKNDKGQYHDPICFKVFIDHTKLVTTKVSGNVYTSDTIEELNRKPKFWKDLISGETFTYKDIIVLQDPKNIESRTIKNLIS
ncbi:unnamed protein product [Paramecium pentaurelia]|uniref:Uncharacterized protein n=1 Tax=Paramecium pentaurelia TaxID=43138 RepID=A0A8S1WV56_9CILI|nr:unnamed protein product [Paramecium pentaurelia]